MIKEKRNSLESFIQEQLIGPGGCKGFYDLNPNTNSLIENATLVEVINTTPGTIYSSAILFPLKGESSSADNNEGDEDNAKIINEESETQNFDSATEGTPFDSVSEDSKDEDDDTTSLSRRFPNRIGLSFCVNKLENLNAVELSIGGRIYRKITDLTSIIVKIKDTKEFTKFFNDSNINPKLCKYYSVTGDSLSLKTSKIKTNDLKQLKEDIKSINKDLCKIIATEPDGSLDPIYSGIGDNYRMLLSYKERLFKKLKKVDDQGNYLDAKDITAIKDRISVIETYETDIVYLEDLLSAYDDRLAGYWAGYDFSRQIDLSSIDFNFEEGHRKKIIKSSDYPKLLQNVFRMEVDTDKYASLSVSLQTFKSKDNDRIYVKIMVENDSTEVIEVGNRYYSIVTEEVNNRSIFGISIDVKSNSILPYKDEVDLQGNDPEQESLNYLYRNVDDYAVGHLCSVDWRVDEHGLLNIWTEFLPKVESPDVEPIPRDKQQYIFDDKERVYLPEPYLSDDRCLRFKWLSVLEGINDQEILEGLREYVDSYKKWIDSLSAGNNKYGQENINKCLADYNRIRQNIEEFLTVPQIMKEFRLMNTAMFIQLWHSKNQNKVVSDQRELTLDYYQAEADDTSIFSGCHAAWRPFQLAFILLNLDGIYQSKNDPQWNKRNNLVDLVWFPTGGGKTESYLGIIALTIIHRRLSIGGQKGNGVAAIMRYTLRLLTTQQFQRALRLILALEQIRRWKNPCYNLGDEEISIGLYVGSGSLPNSYKDLADDINRNWTRGAQHGDTQVPLDVCPWCGQPLTAHPNYDHGKSYFACSNDQCTFAFGDFLPVRLCDEHIYDNPPTLLFGTVDKFAAFARKVDSRTTKSDSRRVFGRGTMNCLPPSLIIQDELHLLLGPLGSAVSLFEGAIDQLCSYQENGLTIKPKIISSTATTRNTSLQIRALYDRDVSIFPKSGTDYDDSFFSFYKRSSMEQNGQWQYESKRKYIGILPTGRTLMTTQMRLAAILFVHRALFEQDNIAKLNVNDPGFIKAADYYYTTISYFNSLKEVGKTDAQFYQEFVKYTRRLFKRVMRYSNMLECLYIYGEQFHKTELTGRLTGSEAVEELNRAQRMKWDPINRLPHPDPQNTGKYLHGEQPADFVLATNMISVGLDVSRFNTIIMNSMPRNIAEYIQASSRVARDKEGLVLTLHNPFRSRDVSHFEKFKEFHEKLYYYVEPISITPYSPKAIEKFMPLYMVTLIRHLHPDLCDRRQAASLTPQKANQLKQELKQYFIDRCNRTQNLTSGLQVNLQKQIITSRHLADIEKWIDNSLEQWVDLVNQYGNQVVYTKQLLAGRGHRQQEEYAVLSTPDDYEDVRNASNWVIPMALRIIEPESVIHINS